MKNQNLKEANKQKLAEVAGIGLDVLKKTLREKLKVDEKDKLALQCVKEHNKSESSAITGKALEWMMMDAVGTPKQKLKFARRANPAIKALTGDITS